MKAKTKRLLVYSLIAGICALVYYVWKKFSTVTKNTVADTPVNQPVPPPHVVVPYMDIQAAAINANDPSTTPGTPQYNAISRDSGVIEDYHYSASAGYNSVR